VRERLSARFRLVGRLVGLCVSGPSPWLRHNRLRIRCPHRRSRAFACPGGGRIDEAIRCRQLRQNTSRRTTRPTPFQRRGCGLPLVVFRPRGAFTEPCLPLTFPWSLAGTPERPLYRPMRCPTVTLLAETWLRTKPASLRTPIRLTGEGQPGEARKRLPSY
jgi:hypothetical protein